MDVILKELNCIYETLNIHPPSNKNPQIFHQVLLCAFKNNPNILACFSFQSLDIGCIIQYCDKLVRNISDINNHPLLSWWNGIDLRFSSNSTWQDVDFILMVCKSEKLLRYSSMTSISNSYANLCLLNADRMISKLFSFYGDSL